MSLPRFFLPPEAWPDSGTAPTLHGDEAAHCARVLRMGPGDALEIFDGAGRVIRAVIASAAKNCVTLTAPEPLPCPTRRCAIHLLPALIKTEPFEWLLEKAVELGAASVCPILTARTVSTWSGDHAQKKLARWQRHMIESAKQCHTPYLPQLGAPRPIAEAITSLPTGALKIMPALSGQSRTLHGIGQQAPDCAYIIIGPEGDFTPEEEHLAETQGFVPVTLGPLILRAETAAITTLAILSHELSAPTRSN